LGLPPPPTAPPAWPSAGLGGEEGGGREGGRECGRKEGVGEQGIGHGRWKVSERIRRHAKQIQKIIRQWSRKDTPTLNLDTLMPA